MVDEKIIFTKFFQSKEMVEASWSSTSNEYLIKQSFTEIFWDLLTAEEKKTALAQILTSFGRPYYSEIAEIGYRVVGEERKIPSGWLTVDA